MNPRGPRQVVITGAALGTPAGYTLEENQAAWWQGRSCFTEISRFNTAGSSVRHAGDCPPPDPKKLPDRKVQKILRRKDIISLLTTIEAARQAGLTPGQADPERLGMYVGASSTQIGDLTPYFTLVAECADLEQGTFDSARFGRDLMNLVNPLVVLQTLMNNGLCFGTMTLDIRGVNANFMDFQAAGLRAIGEGFRSIAHGRAELIIAGGVAGPVEPFQLAEGVHAGFLARTRDLDIPLAEVVKPWDQERRGAILSEGSAYVVLEDEEHARRRGARVLARVSGFALANASVFSFANDQPCQALARSLDLALQESGLAPRDLGGVVGHGNGSVHGDRAEAQAYLDVFGPAAHGLPLASPAAVLGDLCEASGAVGCLFALDALSRGLMPPTFNYRQGDPTTRQLAIRAEPQPLRAPHVAITSRSMLGLCASLIMSAP